MTTLVLVNQLKRICITKSHWFVGIVEALWGSCPLHSIQTTLEATWSTSTCCVICNREDRSCSKLISLGLKLVV